jgi:hypothetical protein
VNSAMNPGVFVKGGEFLVRLFDNQFLKKDSAPASSFSTSKEFQVRVVHFMSHSYVHYIVHRYWYAETIYGKMNVDRMEFCIKQ